jgi:hypothetical protein
MIDRGFSGRQERVKLLGSQSVHGLPLDWPEPKRHLRRTRSQRLRNLLGTQNVHGIPTAWNEVELSE